MNPEKTVAIGDIAMTSVSQPGGLVKILEIVDDYIYGRVAWVQRIEKHPYGYPKGFYNWYGINDLIPEPQPAPPQNEA